MKKQDMLVPVVLLFCFYYHSCFGEAEGASELIKDLNIEVPSPVLGDPDEEAREHMRTATGGII
ncbi:hypothetical protein EON65_38595, partial [archaeon]